MTDQDYMKIALELAKKGCGFVNPNPMVGAVIVKDNKIIGKGYHEKYGGLHAERNAIANCKQPPKGGTIYVNLEPCCHYGKTPPCTEAIIKSGIKRVVIGTLDPNPLVAGKGSEILKNNGIEVIDGILSDECKILNEVFFHFIKTRTPYVVMKYAMTIDGKIATVSGKSKWITGEMSRENVHNDRNKYSAIMVGVGTVLADNPLLTCRIKDGRNPIRIICDTNLKTPLNSQIVSTANYIPTIISTCNLDKEEQDLYRFKGCEVIVVSKKDGHVNLNELMVCLGKMNIDSILLEGGASLNWSALESKIVNKVKTYIAPKIFGGISAKSPIGGCGIDLPDNGIKLTTPKITLLGEDVLLESEVI